jgi:hypothetical protein
MRSVFPGMYDITPAPNVVRRVMNCHELMLVDAVIVEKE